MPKELNFIITLSSDQKDRLRVIASKEKGRILKFVAQYEAFIRGEWRGVVRYDTVHGFAHGDQMITKDEVIKKNLDLINEFMKYAFDHPDVLDKIPMDAELVILPIDDPELYNENYNDLLPLFKQGISGFLVFVI